MNPEAELLAAAKHALTILDDKGGASAAMLASLARPVLSDAIEAYEKAKHEAENGPSDRGDAWEGGFAANH